MDVKASATRIINERGNQVVIITGQVDSNSSQPVLPAGKDYSAEVLEVTAKGGSVFFSLQIEAAAPVEKVEVPKLLSEMTREEQEEAFLKDMLKDPNLDPISRANIRERLGLGPEVKDASQV